MVHYSECFPAAFAFAQRAFAAAAILARAAADILRRLVLGLSTVAAISFLGLPGFRLPGRTGLEPRSEESSFSNLMISSLRSAAWFSCAGVNDRMSFIVRA